MSIWVAWRFDGIGRCRLRHLAPDRPAVGFARRNRSFGARLRGRSARDATQKGFMELRMGRYEAALKHSPPLPHEAILLLLTIYLQPRQPMLWAVATSVMNCW